MFPSLSAFKFLSGVLGSLLHYYSRRIKSLYSSFLCQPWLLWRPKLAKCCVAKGCTEGPRQRASLLSGVEQGSLQLQH